MKDWPFGVVGSTGPAGAASASLSCIGDALAARGVEESQLAREKGLQALRALSAGSPGLQPIDAEESQLVRGIGLQSMAASSDGGPGLHEEVKPAGQGSKDLNKAAAAKNIAQQAMEKELKSSFGFVGSTGPAGAARASLSCDGDGLAARGIEESQLAREKGLQALRALSAGCPRVCSPSTPRSPSWSAG